MMSWNMDTHTFIAALEEFGPTLADVVALTCLSMFGEVKAIELPGDSNEIALEQANGKKLEALKQSPFRVKIVKQEHVCLIGKAV